MSTSHDPARPPSGGSNGFSFVPELDSILPVDECWLVDPRLLARRASADGRGTLASSYTAAVDELAKLGFGCVPDPAAGDEHASSLVSTCIVYRAAPGGPARTSDRFTELHLRLVCAMARSDGTFVGSELAVALELAERLAAGKAGWRLRLRALVRSLFVEHGTAPDPLQQLRSMPYRQACDVVETMKAIAWADGFLREPEERMLVRVHELLGLPRELVGAISRDVSSVHQLAA